MNEPTFFIMLACALLGGCCGYSIGYVLGNRAAIAKATGSAA